MSLVDQYFRGITAGLAAVGRGSAKDKVGVYGSGAVCGAIRAAGLAHYSWLSNSTAWAGSSNYDGWNIKQAGKILELSFSHDYDEARRGYGSFRLSDVAAPMPRLPDERSAGDANAPEGYYRQLRAIGREYRQSSTILATKAHLQTSI
jgi:hypothetical protein